MKKYFYIKHQDFVKKAISFQPIIPISLAVALSLNIASAKSISYDSGTTTLDKNITTTDSNQSDNIFNLSNNASLTINGNITAGNGGNYFYNMGNGIITIGNAQTQQTITLNGTEESKIIITDYKIVNSDFVQSPTGNGTLNLNVNSLLFSGNNNRQSFIADNLKGSINISSLTYGQGNTLIMRFRENNADTSINLSKITSTLNVGSNSENNTMASKLFLQASDIQIGANITANNHSTTEIYLTSGNKKKWLTYN